MTSTDDTAQLYGRLDRDAQPCAPGEPAAWAELPDRYLVILERDDTQTRRAVARLAKVVVAYRAVPLVEIACPLAAAQQVAAIPGVKVIPAQRTVDGTRGIVAGLDFLATMAATQSGARAGDPVYGGLPGGPSPGYPVLVRDDGGWIFDFDPEDERGASPAVIPVINMSIGPKAPDYPYTLTDAVNWATAGAANHALVVVAAGNCGHLERSESAWATPEWVLSVGATEDEEGKALAPYSARGVAAEPETGPDVVAWGRSSIAPHPVGTSFAAPRVAFLVMVCTAAVLQLRQAVAAARGEPPRGVPVVGVGLLDSFGREMFHPPREVLQVPALPILGPDPAGVAEAVGIAKSAGVTIDVAGTSDLLRSMVIAAARPMPGYGPHEVGAGFVSESVILDYLGSLTGRFLVDRFADGLVPASVAARLDDVSLFVREELALLSDAVEATAPQWRFDWRTRRMGRIPVSPEELAGFDEETATFGMAIPWPPAT